MLQDSEQNTPVNHPLTGVVLGLGAATILIFLAIPFLQPADGVKIPQFVLFLGRFHPMILHFPIGWIFLASLVEVLRLPRLRPYVPEVSENFSRLVWFMAAASALVAVLLGWMLSFSGGYDPGLIKLHQTAGVITGIGSVLVLIQLFLPKILGGALRWATILVTLVAMTVAGHIGASITHGEDYLTEYAPEPLRTLMGGKPAKRSGTASTSNSPASTAASSAEKLVFNDQILPMLTTSCISCHGPTKSKGGLRLDSYEAVMKGGDDGLVVVAGDPDKSEILHRLHLPVDDDGHMPPQGKPGLTEAQISALAAWIKAGASPTAKLAASEAALPSPPVEIKAKIASTAELPPEPSAEQVAAEAKAAAEVEAKIQSLTQIPGNLHLVIPGHPQVEFSVGYHYQDFSDSSLSAITPVAKEMIWLDLARANITDAGLKELPNFSNLQRLELQRTAIGDPSVEAIKKLTQLEVLNLDETKITDQGLSQLNSLGKLKRIYVWKTPVTSAGEEAIKKAIPNLQVIRELPAAIPPPAPADDKTKKT